MCRVRLTVDGKTRVYNLTAAAFGRLITAWANRPGLDPVDVLDIKDEKKERRAA